MNVNEILEQFRSLGNEKVREHNRKFGAGDNQFGVKMGDIRALAKKLKTIRLNEAKEGISRVESFFALIY